MDATAREGDMHEGGSVGLVGGGRRRAVLT